MKRSNSLPAKQVVPADKTGAVETVKAVGYGFRPGFRTRDQRCVLKNYGAPEERRRCSSLSNVS